MFVFCHFTGSIIAVVCQVEVVVAVLVTGLIVYFVTRKWIQQKSRDGQDRSGNRGEFGAGCIYNKPLYETIGPGTCTGADVELQPSPAYQAVPLYI